MARTLFTLRHRAESAAAGLPALIAAAEKAAVSVLSGEHAQRKPGMGEKFWQFREYDVSDRPQDIDWRQSARGDRLYVREKEWQTAQTALFWCQKNASMDFRSAPGLPSKQDSALILSLGLSILLARAGENIAPLEGDSPPGHGEAALQKMGERLIGYKTGDLPGPAPRKIPRRSFLVLTGDFLAPMADIDSAFDRLAVPISGAMVIQILDPAELDPPYEGRTIFEPPGGGARYAVDNAGAVRAAYRERLRDHLDGLRASCKKRGWNWLLHSTDSDVRQTLFDAWTLMAPESFHAGGSRA